MAEISGVVDRASRHTGVTGLSWFSASLEVVGALAFGTAGAYAYRRLYLRDQCVMQPVDVLSQQEWRTRCHE